MSENSATEILEIDGSVLEGGGQILRISISLSAILGIPVRVKNIRSGRPKPGLAAQHLKGIQLVAEMCEAQLKGVQPGSTEIEFIPGKLKGGTFYADTQTAGSITLLLQVALPVAVFAPSPVTLELKGGTNAAMAPQIDYMVKVLAPILKNFGVEFDVDVIRRGYYPRGGGHVRVCVRPLRQLRPARLLARGDVLRIDGWSYVAGTLPIGMANEMAQAARQELRGEAPVDIRAYRESKDVARDNGWGIVLVAQLSSGCVLGGDAVGGRGERAAAAGARAAAELQGALRSAACLDQHAQDQVIVYMALAGGQSAVRAGDVTLHTQTAIHVAQLLAKVKFDVSEENMIQCEGLGFVNKYLE